jgi:hypothetical protein
MMNDECGMMNVNAKGTPVVSYPAADPFIIHRSAFIISTFGRRLQAVETIE